MAFDGITIKALVKELQENLTDGYIKKIAQPEKEELLLTVKVGRENRRVLMSANASLPLLYLTEENKTAPLTAPNFCMLLRKHIGGGRIVAVEQIGNERVVRFTVEHRNELGDVAVKFLYVEIMGKHSNIIFCDENDKIIDGIKHISFSTSSVREILPGRDYFIPAQDGKSDPYEETADGFAEVIKNAHTKILSALLSRYIGISKTTANEIAYRAGVDADASTDSLFIMDGDLRSNTTISEKASESFNSSETISEASNFNDLGNVTDTPNSDFANNDKVHALSDAFFSLLSSVQNGTETPCIAYEPDMHAPLDFAPYRLSIYEDKELAEEPSISKVLASYYGNRNRYQNIHQKSTDLRKLVATLLERNQKKLHIQQKQMDDTKKMERFKTYGTLLQIYPQEVPAGAKEVTLTDFETGQEVNIPLDEHLNAIDNAKRYFERYAKLKRTKEALSELLSETETAVSHLASIQNALQIAENEADLAEIRRELFESGYIRKKSTKKGGKQEKSRPLHYVTDDGFHIYVGKNNFQNDELTFKLATGNDWWFHAKQIPGSHVIVRTEGRELPDAHFVTCAQIAGYYSQGRESDKLEIDYVEKKQVKKPSGAVPGFVVYYTNYSMTVKPVLPENVVLAEQ